MSTIKTGITGIGIGAFRIFLCFALVLCGMLPSVSQVSAADESDGFFNDEIIDDYDDEGSLDESDGSELNYYGEFIYDVLEDGTVEIVSYIGDESEIEIPSSIGGADVTSIKSEAFKGNESAAILDIPETVECIESYAFAGCSGLTTINFENGLRFIGDSAFEDCASLCRLTLPETLVSIGSGTFRGCSAISDMTIPDSVVSIGNYAFENCIDLTGIVLPSDLSVIPEGTFSGCCHLCSVEMTGNIEEIGEYAFRGCSALEIVALSKAVTAIGDYAFKGCEKITDVYYEGTSNRWEEISIGTGNDSLTSAEIHYGYTSAEEERSEKIITSQEYPDYEYSILDDGTIAIVNYNGNESSVTIPSAMDGYTVTEIGEASFNSHSGMTSVTVPSTVRYILSSAFAFCSDLEEVIISEGTEIIEDYAFYRCSSLKTITLPESLKDVEYRSFYECGLLADVYYGGSQSEWSEISFQEGNDDLLNADMHFAKEDSESRSEEAIADDESEEDSDDYYDDSSDYADEVSSTVQSVETSDTSVCVMMLAVFFTAVLGAVWTVKLRLKEQR